MKNIIVAGVGGQGLVLATKLIAQAAFKEGLDVKTNDVVGLSQRGGMVWGTVRICKQVNSPNIPVGEGDILLGMEPLETYRWSFLMKDNATVVMNTNIVYPTPVLLEVEEYPTEEIENMKSKFKVIEIDAPKEAKEAGNIKTSNTIMIGVLAKLLDIKAETWEEVLRENVPEKAIEENIKAFYRGYNY